MPMRPLVLLSGIALALSAPGLAQDEEAEAAPPPAFPEFDIFLFDYDASNSESALSNGFNATERAGYDNQPFFTASSETFLYSRDDGTQTDIWEYDIASGAHRQITRTRSTELARWRSNELPEEHGYDIEVDDDPMRRMLFIFQHVMSTVTDRIDHIVDVTDPLRCDAKMLPWLASELARLRMVPAVQAVSMSA